MRLTLLGSTLVLAMFVSHSAHAGRLGGGGGHSGGGHSGGGHSGGGGRLSGVSSGIRGATDHGGPGGSYHGYHGYRPYRPYHHYYYQEGLAAGLVPIEGGIEEPSAGTAHVEGTFSLEKVYDSDGAMSGEVAIEDGWFRLTGGVSHYFERQETAPPLTMTVPSLKVGARVDETANTRVFIEGGVAWAITRNDQMGDSSIAGVLAGIHVDHALTPHYGLVGDAHAYLFMNSDVRAASARAALRFYHVEAGFRVMTFNVAPALFGPEVGVHF